MTTSAQVSRKQDSNSFWETLYNLLRPRVKGLVYSFKVASWYGQAEDLAEDNLQEAIFRTWKYSQRAACNEARPIDSHIHMGMRIAHNYCVDRSRQDGRLIHIGHNSRSPEIPTVKYHRNDPSEAVIEKVFEESLLLLLPPEIVKFPPKLRRALLIDLANLMDFDGRPTPLQRAFLEVGIQLRDYQIPLPTNPVERSRHASLLSLAYKRIRELPCVKRYVSAA